MVVRTRDPGGAQRDTATAFAELSRIPVGSQPLAATLGLITRLAVESLRGVAAASVTLVQSGALVTVGATGPLAADLDSEQYDAGSGPCVDAALRGDTVTVVTAGDGQVFGDFVAVARRHGVTGVLAVGLHLGQRVRGSLNLYRTGDGGFDGVTREVARALAGCAAGAVVTAAAAERSAETARHLRQALASRAVIEQAKGVLLARHGCSPEDAFEWLAAESQRTNRKLRDVARDVVTGARQEAPDEDPAPLPASVEQPAGTRPEETVTAGTAGAPETPGAAPRAPTFRDHRARAAPRSGGPVT
jgi:GAF domain-containing protein